VQMPLQLTFRSMNHSDELATHMQRRAEELERHSDRIISCHVVVERAGHHHRHGDRYRVSINLGLPGHELIVSHDPSDERTWRPRRGPPTEPSTRSPANSTNGSDARAGRVTRRTDPTNRGERHLSTRSQRH
jgi:hypothetical protein